RRAVRSAGEIRSVTRCRRASGGKCGFDLATHRRHAFPPMRCGECRLRCVVGKRAESPRGVRAYERLVVRLERACEKRHGGRVAAVAERDGSIACESAAFRAHERGTGKIRAKFFV